MSAAGPPLDATFPPVQPSSTQVGPEHILLGLIAEDSSKAGFLGCGVTVSSQPPPTPPHLSIATRNQPSPPLPSPTLVVQPETARAVVESLHEPRRARGSAAPKDLPFSTDAKQLFEAALLESRRMGMSFIAPEHIFLAVAASREGPAVGVMAAMGLDVERLKDEAERRLKGEAEGEGLRNKVAAAAAAGTSSRAGKKDGPSALEEFCRNLNEEAAAERTDPVIGRTKEVARVAQILARRSKNNPILLGEPGVGECLKTAPPPPKTWLAPSPYCSAGNHTSYFTRVSLPPPPPFSLQARLPSPRVWPAPSSLAPCLTALSFQTFCWASG